MSETTKIREFIDKTNIMSNYYVLRNIIPVETFKNFLLKEILNSNIRLYYPDNNPSVIITIKKLKWDSEILGLNTVELNLFRVPGYTLFNEDFDSFWQSVEKTIKSENIEYIKVRFNTLDIETAMYLEEKSFRLVDAIIRFNMRTRSNYEKLTKSYANLKVKDGCYDIKNLSKLGKDIFKYDRFHNDPEIPNEIANEIYSSWIRNSCNGKIADKVFTVFNENDEILGFVTCKIKKIEDFRIGYIDLIGVSEKAKGTFASELLLLSALKWFRDMGINYVEIETQVMNIPAIRFYEKWGFRTVQSYFTMRRRINYEEKY